MRKDAKREYFEKITLLYVGGSQSAIFCAIIHYSYTVYGYGKLYVRMVYKFNNFQFVYILVKCWCVIPDNEVCN